MKTKIIVILLVLSVAFNLGIIVTFGYHKLSRRDFRKEFDRAGGHRNRMQKMFNLSEEQARFMDKDRGEIQKENKPIMDELEKKRTELFTLLNADKVDNTKVEKLINDIALLQVKIEKNVVSHLIKIRKNLTPQQQEKFKTIIPKGFMRMPPEEEKRPPEGADMGKPGEPIER